MPLSSVLQEELQALEAVLRVRARAQREATYDLERCRRDIPYWISNFCWTFDPRLPPGEQILPFHLYDYQENYIRWLERRYRDGGDGLLEKSRDMGATWGTLAWLGHHWLYDGAFQALIGSRKEDLVDNWQPDSLFWRLAFLIDHLPPWMLPQGYDPAKHRQHMKLINPESGATILGESSNPRFGRQGRYNAIFLDEFAFWPDTSAVWMGTADSAPCRLAVSTPNPYDASGLAFERLRDSGRVQVYSLHWRQHPKKDEVWFKGEEARRTAEEIAVELEISYQVALTGRVYPEWDKLPRGDFPYVAGWPLFCTWDFAYAPDDTALIWLARNPQSRKYRVVDCYTSSQKTIDFYVPWSTGQVVSGLPYGYTEGELEQIGRHGLWPGATHYGDVSGSQRNQVTGTSVISELAGKGIYVQTKPDMNTFEARYRQTKMFLREIEGINLPACQGVDDALRHARFPKRAEGAQTTAETVKPVHDWTSHYRTALEYMAVNAQVGMPERATGRSFIGRR